MTIFSYESFKISYIVSGRKVKQKIKGKVMMYLLLGMKFLGIGIIMPTLIALALYASWKGITISLLAFLLASIVGIKNLVNGKFNFFPIYLILINLSIIIIL